MDKIRAVYHRVRKHLGLYVESSTEIVLALVVLFIGITQFLNGDGLPHSAFIYMDPIIVTAIVGMCYVISGSLLILGLWFLHLPWSRVVRRIGSFLAFLAFTYTGLIGIFSDDVPLPLAIMSLGFAIISGVLHIKEKNTTHV